MNKKRVLIMFGACLAAAGLFYLTGDSGNANGAIAGLLTGALNTVLIVFTVKKTVVPGAVPPQAAVKSAVVFMAKLGVIGLIIASVVSKNEIFGLAGFITGFTAVVAILLLEGWRYGRAKNNGEER